VKFLTALDVSDAISSTLTAGFTITPATPLASLKRERERERERKKKKTETALE
jgi:hypothetical protein